MKKFMSLVLTFLVVPFLVLVAVPHVYGLGHYGIPGTVEGCNECHVFTDGVGFYDLPASGNLRWVKSTINSRTVAFTSFSSPPGTLADGDDGNLDGPCEVCHTATSYHTNTGDGTTHFDGTDCIICHPHFVDDINNYFEPRFVGTQSHTTHFTDPKGPLLGADPDCTVCHYPDNYQLFGPTGETLEATDVCDECHSQDGVFDGVADAKAKWEDGVYEENGYQLKPGNDNWCAGCHDNGTSLVDGIAAPDVTGDNVTYGYNPTGHGHYSVRCEDCHDLAVSHADGLARTYLATSSNPAKSYRSGYRLNEDMAIPRTIESGAPAFRLCVNCHVYTDIIGPDSSNFRDDLRGLQYHDLHLLVQGFASWDSDWNGTSDPLDARVDSALSCPACHNVHGSPTQAMTRHGELMSKPGTNKVPAMDFRWYKSDGSTQTTVLNESRYGGVELDGTTTDFTAPNTNYICTYCHASIDAGTPSYYRVPGGVNAITVKNVWTTDLNNVLKTSFNVGDDIRYHVSFEITGSGSFFVKSPKKISKAYNTSGNTWETNLGKTDTLGPGNYAWTWDKKIPAAASSPSTAKVKIQLKLFDFRGGTLIDKHTKSKTFDIN